MADGDYYHSEDYSGLRGFFIGWLKCSGNEYSPEVDNELNYAQK